MLLVLFNWFELRSIQRRLHWYLIYFRTLLLWWRDKFLFFNLLPSLTLVFLQALISVVFWFITCSQAWIVFFLTRRKACFDGYKRENIQKYPSVLSPNRNREYLDARAWEHDRRESSQKAFSVAVPGLSGFPLAARRCVLSTLLPPTTAGRKILIPPVKHTHIGIGWISRDVRTAG